MFREYLKKDLRGLKIQIAGISYKNDVSDILIEIKKTEKLR